MENNSDQTLEQVIKHFDQIETKHFEEEDFSSALKRIQIEESSVDNFAIKAEILGFDFIEDSINSSNVKVSFGPKVIFTNNDGTKEEYPSIELITEKILLYWEQRVFSSLNPILKARYAHLVWMFKNKITQTKPNYLIGEIFVNSVLDIIQNDYYDESIRGFGKLSRALVVAQNLNKQDLLDKLKDALLQYENKKSIDTLAGLWGYSFDLLLENKRINLSQTDKDGIIYALEARLNRLLLNNEADSGNNLWPISRITDRLLPYYRKTNQNEKIKNTFDTIRTAYDNAINKCSPLHAHGHLEELYKLYTQYNFQNEADHILIKIRETGKTTSPEYYNYIESYKIDQDNMRAYIDELVTGDSEQVINNILGNYLPSKEFTKKLVAEKYKKDPFEYIFDTVIQDEKGRSIVTVGPLERDEEGHLLLEVSRIMVKDSFTLRQIIAHCITSNVLSSDNIAKYLEQSDIIEISRLEIINRALMAYFSSDPLTFIHLAIPQIEEAIRNLVERVGGKVLKPSKGGGFHLRTFDELLRDNILTTVLGEDFSFYLRALYTDQRGWNLRNSVCHGMATPDKFNIHTADWVLHSLLCLGLVRRTQ